MSISDNYQSWDKIDFSKIEHSTFKKVVCDHVRKIHGISQYTLDFASQVEAVIPNFSNVEEIRLNKLENRLKDLNVAKNSLSSSDFGEFNKEIFFLKYVISLQLKKTIKAHGKCENIEEAMLILDRVCAYFKQRDYHKCIGILILSQELAKNRGIFFARELWRKALELIPTLTDLEKSICLKEVAKAQIKTNDLKEAKESLQAMPISLLNSDLNDLFILTQALNDDVQKAKSEAHLQTNNFKSLLAIIKAFGIKKDVKEAETVSSFLAKRTYEPEKKCLVYLALAKAKARNNDIHGASYFLSKIFPYAEKIDEYELIPNGRIGLLTKIGRIQMAIQDYVSLTSNTFNEVKLFYKTENPDYAQTLLNIIR